MPFQDFYTFPFAQIPDDLLYIRLDLFVYDFSTVFGREYDMILAQSLCMC